MAFNAEQEGMGIGTSGIGDSNVTFLRQNRFTMKIDSIAGSIEWHIPEYFIQVSARPKYTIEETQIDFLNDKMWIPGKVTWDPLTVEILDVAGDLVSGDSGTKGIYQWLINVFDFRAATKKFMASKRCSYGGVVTITMYDGCGGKIEEWQLLDAWPTAVDFGQLDHKSNELSKISLTLRYSQVRYTRLCGEFELIDGCLKCNEFCGNDG